MPILPFSSDIDMSNATAKPLLVFADRGKSVGLIVDEIVDIREEAIEIQLDGKRQGVFGSAIISGKATEIVDVMHFLNSVHGDWFKDHGDEPFLQHDKMKKEGRSSGKRILLVDDSPFFRNMLCPLLTAAGYEVIAVDGPSKALELTESEENFDIIISDIEMPDMNGYDFAMKVRASDKWQNTPMVALTSHATPEDIDHGYEVGFDEYIAKFDRDTLLSTISKTLSKGIEA